MKSPTAAVIAALLIFVSCPAYPQDGRLVPSYDENSGFIRDYPEIDIDVLPYVNSWKNSGKDSGKDSGKNSGTITGHGGFSERPIFTRGDPLDPPSKGAVLKYLKSFNYGFLGGNCETEQHFYETGQHIYETGQNFYENEQTVFYVLSGTGYVESGGKREILSEGSAVFIPAGLEYRFVNTATEPFEVIIIAEEIPGGFEPRDTLTVRRYRDSTPATCCWAYTIYSLFDRRDGLFEPMGIAVVTVESFGMGSPHYHVDGCEEIWLKLKGEESPLMLGKKLLKHSVGEAFLAPPNGLVPHSVINHTDSVMAWLYIGNRHDKE